MQPAAPPNKANKLVTVTSTYFGTVLYALSAQEQFSTQKYWHVGCHQHTHCVEGCATLAGSALEAVITYANWVLETSSKSVLNMKELAYKSSRQQCTFCVELSGSSSVSRSVNSRMSQHVING